MGATDRGSELWRLIVVGSQTRNIGKTQLICDVIQAFPKVEWIAGKITSYGDESYPQGLESSVGAPTEQLCAWEWELRADQGTDSARFLAAGANRSFQLRSKRGLLAECLPLLHQALRGLNPESQASESRRKALIVESNSLMLFVKPSLYFAVIDPDKEDYTDSAQSSLDCATALVLRRGAAQDDATPASLWMNVPAQLLQMRPSVLQRIGEPLPRPLVSLIHQMLEDPPTVSF